MYGAEKTKGRISLNDPLLNSKNKTFKDLKNGEKK